MNQTRTLLNNRDKGISKKLKYFLVIVFLWTRNVHSEKREKKHAQLYSPLSNLGQG